MESVFRPSNYNYADSGRPMNWDMAGAVGEIIGAGAVVISVIYLSVQIKRQTDQARLAASRELATSWNGRLDRCIDDKEFADLFLESATNYSSLKNNERLRISSYYLQLIREMEQQYLHIKKGNIDPSFFESAERTFLGLLTLPGFQDWWSTHSEGFSDHFQGVVNERIAAANLRGYDSSYKRERESAA